MDPTSRFVFTRRVFVKLAAGGFAALATACAPIESPPSASQRPNEDEFSDPP